VRLFCQGEDRLGRLPMPRRRVTLTGVKPLGAGQYGFENFYGYGAVEPLTGERFFLEVPHLNTVNFQILLDALAHPYQDTLTMGVLDNGSCHKAKSLIIPEHIVCLFLPPYGPELHPIERLWQEVKDQWAWVLAAALEELERHVEMSLTHSSNAAIRSLTSYPYIVPAVNAVCS
jgi:transposase